MSFFSDENACGFTWLWDKRQHFRPSAEEMSVSFTDGTSLGCASACQGDVYIYIYIYIYLYIYIYICMHACMYVLLCAYLSVFVSDKKACGFGPRDNRKKFDQSVEKMSVFLLMKHH